MLFKLRDHNNGEFLIDEPMTIENIISKLNTIFYHEPNYIEFTKDNLWKMLIE